MKKNLIIAAQLLLLVGCVSTPNVKQDETPKFNLGNLLGERIATQRMGERLICYYEVINFNNKQSFSVIAPRQYKQCPDHVIKNMYTNQIDWGKPD